MLAELLRVKPVIGRRIRKYQGGESQWLLPVEQLQVGDLVRVMPGERMPADGIVEAGSSCVAKHPVQKTATIIQKKAVGDTVICGAMNGTHALDIRVIRTYADCSLAVEIARAGRKAESERSWWSWCGQLFRTHHRVGA